MTSRFSFQLVIACVALVLTACGGGSSDTNPPDFIKLPASRGLLPMINRADPAFDSVHFAGNGVCSSCHDGATMVDESGRDLSIGKAWESSMMANATRDPYWHAVVETEFSLYPHLIEELNDTCTRCHAPMANEAGRRTNSPIQPFDSGSEENGDFVAGILSRDDQDDAFNHAMDGVSCSFCHQMADDGNLGTAQSMTGGFFVEEYSEAEKSDRPAYGQYADPDVTYMQTNSEFTPVYGAHLSSSETCATCHNLTTASVDRDGVPLAGTHLPEQMVFSEWLESSYKVGGSLEKTCQDCHMPVVETAVPIASTGAGGVVRNNFKEHTFLGANTVMLNIMDEYRNNLGVASGVDFKEAIVRNRQFLATAAELQLVENAVTNGILKVRVAVTNNTGHKLPSGYHSRRAFLHVLVTDESGQVVYENGLMKPDGSIVGVSEDLNPDSYEPHYNKITDPTQVQVYQAIMGNSENERTHSLLNGSHYIKDNRLTPKGFDKGGVSDEIAVKGSALTDPNFNTGKDTVLYEIPVEGSGAYNVLVELMYQPLSFGHLQYLFAKSDTLDRVDMFRTLYESTTLKAETIAAAQGTSN